ncbi:AAA family ATPase [Pantoea sp. B550]|uniref:AAA family ATPase n=1 Tax=unclassified Pantoea TaxID=2630326 RepID=UPI0020A20262|nr:MULTISPECIES: AAA family ATPase [unclassified Pantoea]MCP1204003.1 AAA family ATPase [Pantoea sp. B550]MCT2418140.1 AAA family ATPase [Pantoea sp. XY16]
MNSALTLEALGPRICIMGPSNSGKSTLAEAISRKTNLPVVHLDQLHHLPGSQWIPRAPEAFRHLHADAVSQEKWVMEGNYTKCIEERFAHATGLILLDVKVTVALLRYIRRCYSSTPRIGGLGISRESVSLEMLKYIVRTAPQNRKYHQTLYDQVRLPKVLLNSPHEIKACSEYWGLQLKK